MQKSENLFLKVDMFQKRALNKLQLINPKLVSNYLANNIHSCGLAAHIIAGSFFPCEIFLFLMSKSILEGKPTVQLAGRSTKHG